MLQKLATCLVALSFLGCATIMKQDYEELFIDSTPAGAVVTITGGQKCHTPCSLELERGSDYSLKVTKNGYVSQSFEVKGNSWDGWLWGNIAFIIFPVAIGVDFYTGYAYDFDPERISVDLKKE